MRKVLLTALMLVMPSAFARAGVLGVYNFERVYTPSSVVAGVTLSPVTTTASSSAFYYYGSTAYYYDGYGAIYGAYLGFEVSLAPGAALNLNSISFLAGAIDAHGLNTTFNVQYSASAAFTNPVTMGSFTLVDTGSPTVQETAAIDPIKNGTGSYYFRLNFTSPNISDSFETDVLQVNGTLSGRLLGDADYSGTVDLTDLNIVLNNLGTTQSAWTAGNFDGAATIDLTDLNDVLNHLGTSVAAPSVDVAVVPEPASLGMLAGGALLLGRRRVRRV